MMMFLSLSFSLPSALSKNKEIKSFVLFLRRQARYETFVKISAQGLRPTEPLGFILIPERCSSPTSCQQAGSAPIEEQWNAVPMFLILVFPLDAFLGNEELQAADSVCGV